jgi:hypothetical protein
MPQLLFFTQSYAKNKLHVYLPDFLFNHQKTTKNMQIPTANRTPRKMATNKVGNCFDAFPGVDVFTIEGLGFGDISEVRGKKRNTIRGLSFCQLTSGQYVSNF